MKKIILSFLSLIFILTLCVGISGAINKEKKQVYAVSSSFVMEEGASFRSYWSTPNCGITFGAKMPVSDPNANKVALFLAPYDFVTAVRGNRDGDIDYVTEFDKAGKAYQLITPSVISMDGYNNFRGGLKNIQVGNENRKFFGIYFYNDGAKNVYAEMSNGEEGQARSMAYISSGYYNDPTCTSSNDQYMTAFYMERAIKTAVSKESGKNGNPVVDTNTISYIDKNTKNTTVSGGEIRGTYFDDYLTIGDIVVNVNGKSVNVGQRLNFKIDYTNFNALVNQIGKKGHLVNTVASGQDTQSAKVGLDNAIYGIDIAKYDLSNATLTSQDKTFTDTLVVSGATLKDTYNNTDITPSISLTIPKSGNMLTDKVYDNSNIASVGTLTFSVSNNGANGNLTDASTDIKPTINTAITGGNFINSKQVETTATKNKYNLNVAYVYGRNFENKTSSDNIANGIVNKKYYYNQSYSFTSPSVVGYSAQSNASGVITASNTNSHAILYDANEYELTINYYYGTNFQNKQSSDKIKDSVVQTYYYKQSYSVSSGSVTGYSPEIATVEGRIDTASDTVKNVTFNAQQYSISIGSVTGGSIALNENRKYYYCEPVTLVRTRQNRYGIDSATLTGTNYSSSITFGDTGATTSTNSFNMPATNVTVTPKVDYYGTISFDSHYDYTANAKNVTYVGYYTDVVPTFSNTSFAENKVANITYSSGNTNVVSVSGTRFIGKATGTATITAKTTHISETFNITVNNANNLDNDNGFKTRYSDRMFGLSKYNLDNSTEFTLLMGDSFFDAYDRFFNTYYCNMIGKNFTSVAMSASKAHQWIYFSQEIKNFGDYVPERLVIHIGTNDIFDHGQSASNVTETLQTMLRRLHEDLPSTKIYWYSIEPRTNQTSAQGTTVTTINSNIKSYASSNSGWLTYLDSYTKFNSDMAGCIADGVHPTNAGYDYMFNTLLAGKFTIAKNSNFSGQTNDFTKASQTMSANGYVSINGTNPAQGNFVFTTQITINSFEYGKSPHIAFAFDSGVNHRFLLYDRNNNGRFYHEGDFGGLKQASSFTSMFVGSVHNVAILAKGDYKYLFVDNVLKSCVYYTGSTTDLRISTEYVNALFANNFVSYSNSATYKRYDSMASTKPTGFSNVAGVTDAHQWASRVNATYTVKDYHKDNTQQVNFESNYDNGYAMVFVSSIYLSDLTNDNMHVSFSLDGSHGDNRLIIWDNNNDGVFNFGGAFGGSYTSSSGTTWNGTSMINIVILVSNTKIYWFVNNQLVKIIANLNPAINGSSYNGQVTNFNIRAYGCTANFTHANFELASSNLYNDYYGRPEVQYYKDVSYSSRTVLDYNKKGAIYSISKGNAVANAHSIVSNNSKFTYEGKVLINALGQNGHVSFNFDSNNRVFIWENDKSGKMYYCYTKGGTTTTTANYITFSSVNMFNVKIAVNGTSVTLSINGNSVLSFTTSATVTALTIGAEGCAASFYGNRIF